MLLNILSNSSKAVTSEVLGIELGVSSKTVLNYVVRLNEDAKTNGFIIESIRGKGIFLKVINEKSFEKYKEIKKGEELEEDLLEQIFELLINQEGYIKTENIIRKLYISQSTLSRRLTEIRKIISYYDLKLEAKPYHGIRIKGSEFDFRRFLASHFIQKYHTGIDPESKHQEKGTKEDGLFQAIKTIIAEEFLKSAYPASENILDNLTHHLQIAILRMQEGIYLDISLPIDEKATEDQKLLADKIIKRLEKVCKVTFSENDRLYVIGQLLGKRKLSNNQSSYIPEKINKLTNEILQEIKKVNHLDFMHDLDLFTMLTLHIVPLIDRIQLGIELKNPLLDEVKIHCIAAYDIAITAGKIINDRYGTQLSDHELSYLAMHFDSALNRKNSMIKKKNILVICNLGPTSEEMLKVQFEQHFSHYINLLIVCDHSKFYEKILEESFDYIFTTIPFEYEGTIPVFNLDFFLKPATIQKIEDILNPQMTPDRLSNYFKEELFFLDQSFSSKKEILSFLFKETRKHLSLPNDFEKLVLEREDFFGTDLLPNVAFPHPNKLIAEETTIAVLTLNKPIIWHKNSIRLVMLILTSKEDHMKMKYLLDSLIQLCSSSTNINEIINSKSFNEFINLLNGKLTF